MPAWPSVILYIHFIGRGICDACSTVKMVGSLFINRGNTLRQKPRPKGSKAGVWESAVYILSSLDVVRSPRLKLMFFLGASKVNFCSQHTVHLPFWQPISMILRSYWAWQFWPGLLKSQHGRRSLGRFGWAPIATPHFDHCACLEALMKLHPSTFDAWNVVITKFDKSCRRLRYFYTGHIQTMEGSYPGEGDCLGERLPYPHRSICSLVANPI